MPMNRRGTGRQREPKMMANLALMLLGLLVSCRGGLGATCATDDNCRSDLVCHQLVCTTPSAKQSDEDAKASNERVARVRAFLKDKLRMTDEAANRLCSAGETLAIARDRVAGVVFCIKRTESSFQLVHMGKDTAEPLCGEVFDDTTVLGDAIHRCR
jgi:hypothetical protein